MDKYIEYAKHVGVDEDVINWINSTLKSYKHSVLEVLDGCVKEVFPDAKREIKNGAINYDVCNF